MLVIRFGRQSKAAREYQRAKIARYAARLERARAVAGEKPVGPARPARTI